MKLKDLCFEIIQKCPNNCAFCSSCSGPTEELIISYELFKKTIDRFIALGGIEELSISGGEPTLHPDLINMVRYAKSKGIKVILYTSGVSCNEKKLTIDEINAIENPHIKRIISRENGNYSSISREKMRLLKEAGLDQIVFDFQSINEEHYNNLMQTKGYLPYALKSLAIATALNMECEIHFIPLKTNQNDILDILEISELGVRKVRLLRFITQGRGAQNSDLTLSNEELAEFILKVNNHGYKVEVGIGVHLAENDTHKCTAGLSKLLIRYDGKILPCAAFKDCSEELLSAYDLSPQDIKDNFYLSFSNGVRLNPLCKELKRISVKSTQE